MSYDLYLLRVPHHGDAVEIYRQCLEIQEEELNPGPSLPEVEREKHRLAKLLTQFDTELQIAEFDFAGLAQMQNLPLDEVRTRYRHLELNRTDYTGIQLTLWDNYAEVTFPYWHSGEQAEAVLRRVWEHLEVLEAQGGFTTYDPQLNRTLDLRHDFSRVLAGYCIVDDRDIHRTSPK